MCLFQDYYEMISFDKYHLLQHSNHFLPGGWLSALCGAGTPVSQCLPPGGGEGSRLRESQKMEEFRMDSPENTMKNTMRIPRNTTSFCHEQVGTGFLKYFEGPREKKQRMGMGWWAKLVQHLSTCKWLWVKAASTRSIQICMFLLLILTTKYYEILRILSLWFQHCQMQQMVSKLRSSQYGAR